MNEQVNNELEEVTVLWQLYRAVGRSASREDGLLCVRREAPWGLQLGALSWHRENKHLGLVLCTACQEERTQ